MWQKGIIVATCFSLHLKDTGCFKKLISFHKLISMQIPVKISSHFDGMFLNR